MSQSFLEQGGDSLAAMRLWRTLASIRAGCGSLDGLMEQPLATVAAGLGTAGADRPIEPTADRDQFPLSVIPKPPMVLKRGRSTPWLHHVFGAHRISGNLNPDQLAAAFEALATRHEILRTTFSTHRRRTGPAGPHRTNPQLVVATRG